MKKALVIFVIIILFVTVVSAQSWIDLNNKAVTAYNEDDYNAAIEWERKALVQAEAEFGTMHSKYATTVGNLALFYKAVHNYAQAEPLYKQAIEIDRKVLEENDPDFATDINNLAGLYRAMRNYVQAEPLYKQALEIRRKSLGEQHPVFVSSLNNLAFLYEAMGNYAQAEIFYKQVVEARRKISGTEHPDFATSLNNLAELYRILGKYPLAEPLYKQALEIDRKALGEENPEFATDLNNLAELYRAMGNYAQAEPLYLQALEIRRKKLGQEHRLFANSLNNLALLYKTMGKYTQAEPLYKQALEIDKKVLGEDHPDFGIDLNNLAGLYQAMGNYAKAEPLYLQALEIARKSLGTEHPDFAMRLNNLAALYRVMGKYAQAEPLYKQALEIRKRTLGEEHPDFAVSLNNLAELYDAMGNYARAEPLYKQALEIDRKALGEDHTGFAGDLNNLAGLYATMGNYTQAEPLYKQALEINRKIFGEEHPAFANSLNNLALLYDAMGNYVQAETLYKQALEIRKKTLGEDHPDFAVSLNNLAELYRVMGKYTQAEPLYKQSLEIRRKTLGEDHPGFATALSNLALLYGTMGNYLQAEPLYKQALEIKRKALGVEHPGFADGLSNLASVYMNTGAFAKAAALLDSCNHILLSNISRNYAFLSEDEKEKYNKTILYHLDAYNGFVYKHHTAVPSSITHCFNNMLATSSLLLKSNIAIQHVVSASSDTALKRKYDAWIELRKTIARSYNLSVEERARQGVNTRDMEEQAHEIEKDLVKIAAVFTSTNSRHIAHATVRSALNDSEAVIEFSGFQYYNGRTWTDSVLYCAYITRKDDAAPVYVPLFEEKELMPLLADMVHSDRGLAIDISGTDIAIADSTHVTLYSLFWKKLEPHLKGITTIYLAPSGLLHKVSFERIKDEGGNYLLNKYNLHHILGSSEIIYLKESKKAPKINSIALLGGARFDLDMGILQQQAPKTPKTEGNEALSMHSMQRNSTAFSPWPYLKGTLDEVMTISKTLSASKWKTTLDTGTSATEEQLIAHTGNNTPEVLHIATHGFYLPPPKDITKTKTRDDNIYKIATNPLLRSGIILSGANYKWVENKDIPNTENGIVTALDISNLDFSNASLVVLSACETGLGDIQSGEGVYGLQRAFRLAGVENIIISLWQVPDKETAEMMELFYSTLAKGKVSYYEAFNIAQKTMQKQYPNEPLKWAAFELVGQ